MSSTTRQHLLPFKTLIDCKLSFLCEKPEVKLFWRTNKHFHHGIFFCESSEPETRPKFRPSFEDKLPTEFIPTVLPALVIQLSDKKDGTFGSDKEEVKMKEEGRIREWKGAFFFGGEWESCRG
jgi:hypothetical protein